MLHKLVRQNKHPIKQLLHRDGNNVYPWYARVWVKKMFFNSLPHFFCLPLKAEMENKLCAFSLSCDWKQYRHVFCPYMHELKTFSLTATFHLNIEVSMLFAQLR